MGHIARVALRRQAELACGETGCPTCRVYTWALGVGHAQKSETTLRLWRSGSEPPSLERRRSPTKKPGFYCEGVCRTSGAWIFICRWFPVLTHWANLWRTSGARDRDSKKRSLRFASWALRSSGCRHGKSRPRHFEAQCKQSRPVRKANSRRTHGRAQHAARLHGKWTRAKAMVLVAR